MQRRQLWVALYATGHDDGPAEQRLPGLPIGCRIDREKLFPREAADRDYLDAGVNRQVELFRVALELADEVSGRAECTGLRPRVGQPRQRVHEVGRIKAKGVPALGQPGFADPPPFEHDVLAVILAKKIAGCQTGLASTYDDSVQRLHGIYS